jgi:hypothetical protein
MRMKEIPLSSLGPRTWCQWNRSLGLLVIVLEQKDCSLAFFTTAMPAIITGRCAVKMG